MLPLRARDIATGLTAALMAALLVLPAAASASQGGVSAPDPNASYLNAGAGAYLGKKVVVRGHLAGATPGQRVDIQGRQGTEAWQRITGATVKKDGTFAATWTTTEAGRYDLRAVPSGASTLSVSADRLVGTSTIVHKPSKATWFGPSDNGTETACGVTLTDTVLGVANKSLPCGTEVSFLFHGKQLTVPVIDRGPYRAGVSWDLTIGAANALGFTDTGMGSIGAVVLRTDPLASLAKLG